jgi:hypothetical protein
LPHPVLRQATLLLALGAAIPAAAGPPQRHGDWVMGCDQAGRCTLVGLPSAEAAARLAIRIEVDAAPRGAPRVDLIPLGSPRGAVALGPFPPSAPALRHDLPGGRIGLTEAWAAAWIALLFQGRAIEAQPADPDAPAPALPDPGGFSAAWVALAAARAAALRHPAPPPHRLAPAREAIPPAPLPGAPCAGALRQFALPGGARLWSLACGAGRLHWFLAPARGAPAPLSLPDGGRPALAAGLAGLAGSGFDVDAGILRAEDRPQGREDCGIARAWGWDGAGWALLERREMPVCGGLDRADWIPSWGARGR